jgi:hypothetical protein
VLDKPLSLRSHVAAMFDHEGLDPDTIVDTLIRRAGNDPHLRNALIVVGAKQAVRGYYHDGRGEAYPMRGARAENSRQAKVEQGKISKAEREAREVAKTNRRQIIDGYALWGYTLLRDARKEDLRMSIANRQAQVQGGLRAIRFEEAILKHMTSETKTCGELLSAKKIDQLWMQHYGK